MLINTHTPFSCLGPTVWRDVRPLQGFWRVPWNASLFERCPYVNDCRGYDIALRHDNQTAPELDGCIAGTEGLLCSQCSPGFNRDVAVCNQCSADALPIRIGILCGALVVVALLLNHCANKIRNKWRRYRPIWRDLLRIGSLVVTYSQINTSIPNMIDVPWPAEFVNFVAIFNVVNIDIFSLVGVSCVGNLNFYLSFIGMACVPVVIVILALLNYCRDKKTMLSKVKHLSDDEQKLEEVNALHMLYHISDLDGEGSIDNVELSKLLNQLGWAASPEVAYGVLQHFHDDGTKAWSNETGQLVLTEAEFVVSMLDSKMSKLLTSQNVQRVGSRVNKDGTIKHTKQSQQDTLLCDRDVLIGWVLAKRLFANSFAGAMMLLMLAHTPVSRKVFQFFHCNDIGGRHFLRADYSIECGSLYYLAFFPIVLVVLVVFTIGLPGMISFYLWKNKTRLYSTKVHQNIGWLIDPYHRGAEFWTIHDVILKSILTGALIYIPETARAAVALMVGVSVCCTLNYFRPHKSHLLFWLNQISFTATTFKYVAALMLRVDHTKYNDGSKRSLGWMLIGLDLSFLCGGVVCFCLALWELRRRLLKLQRVKKKMRTLARTATSMEMMEFSSGVLDGRSATIKTMASVKSGKSVKSKGVKIMPVMGDTVQDNRNLRTWEVGDGEESGAAKKKGDGGWT